MSNVKLNRLLEVCKHAEKNGDDETLLKFGITRGTLRDYKTILRKTDVTLEYLAPEKEAPKILILDIETAPLLASVWGLWKQNINLDFLINDWFMLSWSAKWLHDEKVYTAVVSSEESLCEDDERITKSLWQFVNEADIVVAHNGKNFDIKRINTRFLFHGLNPPLPYKVIDTLEAVKRTFAISSNRMDYINKFLNLERKMDTGGAELWVKCLKGEKCSLKLMADYNAQDVIALEQMYLRILAWIPQHPNYNVYTKPNVSVCGSCGSKNITYEGYYYTDVSKFPAYRCDDCGHVGRGRATQLDKQKRQSLVV